MSLDDVIGAGRVVYDATNVFYVATEQEECQPGATPTREQNWGQSFPCLVVEQNGTGYDPTVWHRAIRRASFHPRSLAEIDWCPVD